MSLAAVDPISYFQALVLGIAQGLTEFLPISSSAHLRITAGVAGWQDPGAAFTAVTQIGTELAVVLYFRKDIARILHSWFASLPARRWPDDPDARLGWLVIFGTLPIVVFGLFLETPIDSVFRDLRLTAITLIVFGLILGWADRRGRDDRELGDMTVRHGLAYGFAQAMALVPGVSRSGGTITAGRLMGYSRAAATRYAFLLAVPAVFGSGVYKLKDIGGDRAVAWGPTILATGVAFAVGFVVIAWLMRFLQTRSYAPFVAYRVALGVLILVLVFGGVLDPESGAA